MSLPMAFFGLEVPAGDVAIPAMPDIPAAFRITMAAIDPTAEAEEAGTTSSAKPRATLSLIRQPILADYFDDEEDSDFDEEEMEALLAEEDSDEDEESSEDEEEANGGPSDPSKSKKARKAAAAEQIRKELESAMELDVPNGINGKAKGKGKAVVAAEDDEEEDEDEDEEEDDEEDSEEYDSEDDFDELDEPEEFVICTLDPERLYQQPLDIVIGENERVWFKVSGTHSIHLTGNYVDFPHDHDESDEDDYEYDSEDEYDLSPDEDELELEDMDVEDLSEDDLDDLEDPRITEVESEEEAPVLVKADKKKGKNKRAAEDSDDAATLDDLISKAQAANPEKLSKKQAKKLKNNAGQAVAAEKEEPSSAKSDKKVQFAEKLESGPTPSAPAGKDKATGPKVIQGVTVDVRKAGDGDVAKKGDRVSMRYIGKLQKDGKVFDSNKKGKPFSFKLGVGEVIKGWDVGVNGLRAGSEARLTIPAHMGYGSKGAPPSIPGNATLIFDVKLLEIKKN